VSGANQRGLTRLISATEVPNILRVVFQTPISDNRQGEVICYVRTEGMRLGIYYSHHVWRRRATPVSAWEDENTMRLPMSAQLESQIMVNVPYEIWSTLAKTVAVLPGAPGIELAAVPFES